MLSIKRSLYDSKKQLKDDFSEYPPSPILKPSPRGYKFYKTFTSAINQGAYRSVITLRAMFGSENNVDQTTEFGSEVMNLRNDFWPQFDQAKKQWKMTKKHLTEMALLQKILIGLIFIIFSPLVVVIVILYVVMLALKIVRSARQVKNSAYGYYIPIAYNGRPELVANKSKITKPDTSLNIDGIISHEHIHMLQNIYFSSPSIPSRKNNAFSGIKGERLKAMMKDPTNDFSYYEYYFLLNEMEARLHEIVLSCYRINKMLPRNQTEFLEMLLCGEKIGALLRKHSDNLKCPITEGNYHSYKVRCEYAEWDIFGVLTCLKDKQTTMRYVAEVLTVMYGNLLYLYGGEQESQEFMDSITCNELYTELYG